MLNLALYLGISELLRSNQLTMHITGLTIHVVQMTIPKIVKLSYAQKLRVHILPVSALTSHSGG